MTGASSSLLAPTTSPPTSSRRERELWRGGGFNPKRTKIANTIGTPIAADGLVYTQSRGRMGPLIVYRGGGTGDVSTTHRQWTFDNGPHIPSPVTDGQFFYSVTDNGILWCLKGGSDV